MPISAGGATRLVLSESRSLRIGSMALFYFTQGLPIGLFLTGIASWISANGATPAQVATLVATTYLPWSFKFIGAALMDRYTYLPMGRRRAWLIGSQSLMVLGLIVAALAAPTEQEVTLFAWVGFCIFCGSAMQDVAVDGLAVDILPEEEQGMASAFMFGGQALGIAVGAAAGGYLLDHFGARFTFLAIVPIFLCACMLAILLRERPGEKMLPWTRGEASAETRQAHGVVWQKIVAITATSMVKRDSLFLLAGSAFSRATGGAFTAFWPYFATTQVGMGTSGYSAMIGTIGLVGSVACMGIGSLMVGKLGPKLATIIAFGGYGLLAMVYIVAPQLAMIGSVFLILSIYLNLTETLSSVCSNPLRMRLSDRRVGATQFTLYNSLSNLPVPLGASLFAWAAGAGGAAVLMPILLCMIVVGGSLFAQLRIGRPVDHEMDPIPALN